MREYIKQQSVGEIVRNTTQIYGNHLPTILVPYALLQMPALVVQDMAQDRHETGLFWVALFAGALLGSLAYGMIVVVISEVCLGSTPSLRRAFRYVFSKVFWTLLGTSVLQGVVIVLGLVLLVIPGVVFILWFLFTPVVVILENKSGRAALSRSKALGSGYHWRTLGVIVIWSLVGGFFGAVIGGITGALGTETIVLNIAASVLQVVVQSVMIVSFVLLYYDLRVRKEAYDTAGLAEDLAR